MYRIAGSHLRSLKSPDFASKAVDLAAGELLEVATPRKVTQERLDRAKEATKSAVLMNLESRSVASEDIGRKTLTYGERKPIEHFLKDLEEITLNDISSTAKNIISSPLTMASWGNVIHVPSYESVSRKFHSKWANLSCSCMTCSNLTGCRCVTLLAMALTTGIHRFLGYLQAK